MRGPRIAGWLCAALTLSVTATSFAQETLSAPTEIPDGLFDELKYRHIGPVGNRVIAVTGEPGDPRVYYAGAASGGIFKTTDGGAHWQPVFDEEPVSSIGSLAVAPSDPNVVWAGTGETFIRANISIGNGIYRSTDRGKTWQHRGLEETGRIGRVLVHPEKPDVVYAAALGHVYGPQQERGVYRTTDGGESWKRVLFVDENTGCSDLVMDPGNPRILFAGMWQIHVNTWSRQSGGPGSGLYTSRDGGESWEKLEGGGLPDFPWGKIGLTMSAADSGRVYALIETNSNRDFESFDEFQGVLWRSDDGGESWTMASADNNLVQRPLYYSRALAAPDDADEVYFMSVRHSTSLDGGKTAFSTKSQPGWDHHDMWIDPGDAERMIVGHDGGVSISTNGGASWSRPQLPIAQMHHVNVDRRIPYFVYGNRQDGPSARGPSNTLTGGAIPIGAWHSVGGCEVGFAVPDPVEEQYVWTGCFDGILELHDLTTGRSRNVSVWPDAVESWPAGELKYRFQWSFPIAMSPHDHRRVYVGSQFVHMTADGGESWDVISPDLTTDDPELQRRTGGLTLDDAGPTIAPVVFAIAESPLEEGLIWAGTNDGLVQLTRDGGRNWTDVTANLPDLPPRGTVSNVEPSRHAAGTCYLTVDRHQLGDTDPHVYKTADYGQTWTKLSDGIPRSVFSYAHCVREDPVRPGLLYLGTENGVWVSWDDGGRWHSLQSNLPHAPVHWLAIQEDFNDLVVATYGRGFWILDDVTPLQQLTAPAAPSPEDEEDAAALLFAPRPAYRFRFREPPMSQPEDPAAGENPEYGASLHYRLAADLDDEEELEVAVLDSSGVLVATLEDAPTKAGLHRLHWNLRYTRTREVKLRTKPEENPHVPIPEKGWRPLSDGGRLAVLAPPGTYTVRLTAGDDVLTRALTVEKDPATGGSEGEIRMQAEVLFELRDMLNLATDLVNEIEWLRKQLDDLDERLRDTDRPDSEEIREAAEELDDDLKELESAFFDLRLTGARQDTLRWRRLLYSKIAYLARSIGGSDFPPTSQQLELYDLLRQELEARHRRFAEIRDGDVAAFNEMLRGKGVPHLITGLATQD